MAAEGAHLGVAARSADQVTETVELVRGAGGRAEAFPLDDPDGAALRQMIVLREHDAGHPGWTRRR